MTELKWTLLIGGAGYIGTRVAAELVLRGRRVTVLGRKPIPDRALPLGVAYCQGDFADVALLAGLLDKHQEVIHLAYASTPNTIHSEPLADLLQNLSPAIGLFAAAAERSCKLLLVSSGGTVYGEALESPISELHPTRPVSPYGVTKLTIENYARMYSITKGLSLICVRPANAYGVGQRPFSGQGFISTAMASVMCGAPIKIFGGGNTVRDYIYVDDLAAGIVDALEKGQAGEIYNLGSGQGHSNNGLVEIMSPLLDDLGFQVRVEYVGGRAFDVMENVLDVTKMNTETGWVAKVGLLDGLYRTANWLNVLHG